MSYLFSFAFILFFALPSFGSCLTSILGAKKYEWVEDSKVLSSYNKNSLAVLSPGVKFDLVVWNVFKFEKSDFLGDFKKISQSTHLMLLQEVVFNSSTEEIAVNEPSFYWQNAKNFYLNDEGSTSTGLSILSQVLLGNSGFQRSEGTEPLVGTAKMFQWSFSPISRAKNSLLIVNIHAINFVRLSVFKKQVDQLVQLVQSHSGPVIVGGDFNTHTRARKKYLDRRLNALDLELAIPAEDNRLLKLDHVYTRSVKVHEFRILEDIKGSDHKPLKLKLSL